MESPIQPNTPPVTPLSQVSVLPSKNWLKILLFILSGLIIVAGLVFVGIQIGKNQVPNQQSIVVQSTVNPTPSLNADWKTYISNTYGFSFSYPNNWMYGEDNSLNNRYGINIYLRPKESKPADPTYGEINIWIFNSTKTLNEFIDSELCNEPGGCTLSNDVEIIKLGEIDAKVLKDKGGPLPSDTVVIKNNNVIIEFDFNYNGENRENYSNLESKRIFDQILSTFRFTN